jgi:hypothetical protein
VFIRVSKNLIFLTYLQCIRFIEWRSNNVEIFVYFNGLLEHGPLQPKLVARNKGKINVSVPNAQSSLCRAACIFSSHMKC